MERFWLSKLNVNQLWDIMLEVITEAADFLCPFKKIRMSDTTPACFTKEPIEMVNRKKELTRFFCLKGREEDHTLLKKNRNV